ncbi:MAG: hypothetical protein KA435_04055 [Azonexus sp.]|nr:hypothetical protein [Azonexus sp.]MBP6202213.1 hypothetical protein [Azonexus sp.]
MFLSSHEIARSREHALNNFLGLSDACIDAGQRFSELISTNTRNAVHQGGRHFAQVGHGQLETMFQLPVTAWLESAARASRLLDGALEIASEAHKAMIRNTESQVCMIDEMAFATINRATKTSPWEAEFFLQAMKASLQNAEQALHDISDAAIETVTPAENEAHQTTEVIAPSKPAPRKRAAAQQKTG